MEGLDDEAIRIDMGLIPSDFENLKKQLLFLEAESLKNKPTEQTYIEYLIQQQVNLKDLTEMIKQWKADPKAYTALVGAIRARSEILDKTINRGQEFGLIAKEPKKHQHTVSGGVVFAQMSTKELQSAVIREMKQLQKITKMYSEEDIALVKTGEMYSGEGDPLEAKALELMSSNKIIEMEAQKPTLKKRIHKSNRSKVAKGRIRVRQKSAMSK